MVAGTTQRADFIKYLFYSDEGRGGVLLVLPRRQGGGRVAMCDDEDDSYADGGGEADKDREQVLVVLILTCSTTHLPAKTIAFLSSRQISVRGRVWPLSTMQDMQVKGRGEKGKYFPSNKHPHIPFTPQ